MTDEKKAKTTRVKLFNAAGQVVAELGVRPSVAKAKVNDQVLHDYVVQLQNSQRSWSACTKTRGDVKASGKKPWRQKGTGRARAGSIRSPLWRGGGITFGPTKERVFKKKINKKMKRLALLMVLSAKVKNNLLVVLDKINLENPKTKLMEKIMKSLPIKGSALIALAKPEKNIILASRNLPQVETIEARNLNALDVLSSEYLILLKETIKVIKETFLK